jgi:hypothetical protein
MFTVHSYIRYPTIPIRDLDKVDKSPLYYFIDINNTGEILRIKKDLDFDYIDGVIFLTYNNQIVMPFSYYDLIDQLWAYLLNMMEEYLKTKKSEMFFPDQPLPMSMKYISEEYILFEIRDIPWKFPTYEFFTAMLIGAKDFFEKLSFLIEEKKDECTYELQRIALIQQKLYN